MHPGRSEPNRGLARLRDATGFREGHQSRSAWRPPYAGSLLEPLPTLHLVGGNPYLRAIAGYAATRGQRDFSSVTQVVATRYEVLRTWMRGSRCSSSGWLI